MINSRKKAQKSQRVEIIIGDEWMEKKGSRAKTPRRRDKNSLSQRTQCTQREKVKGSGFFGFQVLFVELNIDDPC